MAGNKKNKNKNIMIQGTMSGVGKSWITTALCRILYQDGYKVAPFKSQNMALNNYITRDGLEMSRAQAIQAEAAGLEPDIKMNPVLLKPVRDTGSEVIVNGKSRGIMSAKDYFKYRKNLIPEILEVYKNLAAENDYIIIEGAGSPAEVNLKEHDIVNMGLAERVDAPVLLVGDIDRGGVFAQLYGTVELLSQSERERVRGLVVNQFRGDLDLFQSGVKKLEELTGVPVLGVMPYLNNLGLDEEDSLAPVLRRENNNINIKNDNKNNRLDIAVIRLPRMANFTDFMPFSRCKAINLRYVYNLKSLGNPDMLILPDTGNVEADLKWLEENDFINFINKIKAREKIIIFSVGGGFEILNKKINNINKNINNIDKINGLYWDGGQIFGTNRRGLFDNAEILKNFLKRLCERKNLNFADMGFEKTQDARQERETRYNRLADAVRAALDMDKIKKIMDRDI